mmetsp:Transcript_11904/g.35478  ORF Transcript_11904/g.35478 Transcript_11904/m.35478 type:complete len:288 (+) Transcript_11904:159-1022(+)
MTKLLALVALRTTAALQLQGVKNLRAVGPLTNVYRSATLDNVTAADAATLLAPDGRRLAVLIDLRNDDETASGAEKRTDAAREFYAGLGPVAMRNPFIGNIDAFWTAVASQAPPLPLWPKVQMLWSSKPLDAALARALEDGGLPLLYKSILASAPKAVGRAFDAVVDCAVAGDAVIFHCQKGKDRTGLLAALIEDVCGVPREEIVAAYAVSGGNLGGEDAKDPGGRADDVSRDGVEVDWSRFRGSPASAMTETLEWLDDEYGGPRGYLAKSCGVSMERQAKLRELVK